VFGGLAWAPDGSAIVFAPFNSDSLYELHRVALDGSGTTVLFPNDAHEAFPSFAPDGRLGYGVNGVISRREAQRPRLAPTPSDRLAISLTMSHIEFCDPDLRERLQAALATLGKVTL
jgi:hypothetical protein